MEVVITLTVHVPLRLPNMKMTSANGQCQMPQLLEFLVVHGSGSSLNLLTGSFDSLLGIHSCDISFEPLLGHLE